MLKTTDAIFLTLGILVFIIGVIYYIEVEDQRVLTVLTLIELGFYILYGTISFIKRKMN